MLPNIMNGMPMMGMTPANSMTQGLGSAGQMVGLNPNTPQSGTVGFDFNSYLLGLQNKAVEGAVDWSTMLQSTELTDKTELASNTESDGSANGMSALAALFNLSVPTQENGDKSAALEFLSGPKQSTSLTQAVDWKALGMTKVTPEQIQEQGWNMQKVEQLFASRAQDLKEATQEALDALPGGGKLLALEGKPAEKAQPFQKDLLSMQKSALQMTDKNASEVQNLSDAKKLATTTTPQGMSANVGEANSPVGSDSVKSASKEEVKNENPGNSVFSNLLTTSHAPVKSHENLMTASMTTAATTQAAPTSNAQTPEWVTRAESLAAKGGGKMTIALSPPELGKVEVDIVTRGKNVEVEMRSDNEGARKTLESGMADLKSALLGQDLFLAKSEVKVSSGERLHMDGFTAQNFQQHNQTSQERQSQGNSQGYSERQSRWGFAEKQVADVSRSPVSRHTSNSVGRLDVRI